MRHVQLRFESDFEVVTGSDRSQAAVMVLEPGSSTGGPDNRHSGSDQWLYVVSGEGSAVVDAETHLLRPGVLLLIERGEAHEIRCADRQPLHTLNFYVPPAYTSDGETLPNGEG